MHLAEMITVKETVHLVQGPKLVPIGSRHKCEFVFLLHTTTALTRLVAFTGSHATSVRQGVLDVDSE